MKEIWKDIIGYETFYEVSNLGNIRRIGKKKLIYPCKNQVTLSKNGKLKTFKLSRLVALAFIANPDNKPFVRHKNGLINDNRPVNLEWSY